MVDLLTLPTVTGLPLLALSLLAALGFGAGTLNGLLGIGGGILLIPLLIYGTGISMHQAAGITAVQGVVSGAVGIMVHRRRTQIDATVGLLIASTGVLAAALAALASQHVPPRAIILVYLAVVVAVLASVLLPVQPRQGGSSHRPQGIARRLRCLGIGAVGGTLTGLVGAGGSFVAVPMMLRTLGMPVREAIGTSMIVLLTIAAAATLGKAATGQVPALWTAGVIGGSLVGAQVGAHLSHRASPRLLHRLLAGVLSLILVRVLWDVVVTLL